MPSEVTSLNMSTCRRADPSPLARLGVAASLLAQCRLDHSSQLAALLVAQILADLAATNDDRDERDDCGNDCNFHDQYAFPRWAPATTSTAPHVVHVWVG